MSFPNSLEELLRQLDTEYFPEATPKPGDPADKIMFEAGQRSVVHFLRSWRASAGNPPPSPRQRGRGRPVRAGPQ